MDQPNIKLVQWLKSICNYNNKYPQKRSKKNDKHGEGEKNYSDFRVCLNLSDHQLKIHCYKRSLVYKKHMVTTNQKSTRDT